MIERISPLEKQRSVARRAEELVDIIDNDTEIHGSDIAAPEAICGAFDHLSKIHAEADHATDPASLLRQIGEARTICRKIGDPVRAYELAAVVTELARFDHVEPVLTDDIYEIPDFMPPQDLPAEQHMPEAYYATLGRLVVITSQAQQTTWDSHGPDIEVASEAVVAVGGSNLGKVVQQTLLRRLREIGASEEELFEGYLSASNKARLPAHYIDEDVFIRAHRAIGEMAAGKNGESNGDGRLGNYIRGTHDVMGAAVILRREMPQLPPHECVAALYANAGNLGTLTQRLTSANPLDHKLDYHDAYAFMERVDDSAYKLKWTDESFYPQLVIPVGAPNGDEFPEYIFSKDSRVRDRQEKRIERQRMHASRCPVRYPLRLPEGETKKCIEQFDADIKEYYGVDPGIFVNGIFNPAALVMARVIQAGVQTGGPERNLWTHGFEEYGVPAAEPSSRV